MNNKHIIFAAALGLFVLTAAGCFSPSDRIPENKAQIDQTPATTTGVTVTDVKVETASATPATQPTTSAGKVQTATGTAERPVITQEPPSERVCRTSGGSLITINAPTGRWESCYFLDDSLCEIESLRMGYCQPGACRETCLHGGTKSEGWYDSCSGWLIRWAKCANRK